MADFPEGTLRILHPQGHTVGTGFLVSKDLAVTCAHVVADADAIKGDTIQVQFNGQNKIIGATVEFWLDIARGDVAVLRLDAVPDGILPLRLAPAASCRPGSEFRSFGYATAADVQGIHANGTVDGYLPEHRLLQLQSRQANHGISGAPVLDEKRGVVVGMITKGHTKLGRNELTTFATPSEIIWQVCPQLKPIVSPLPRRNPIVEGINLLPYDYDQRIQNFLTEYLGTDSHPVPFGGRDDALKILDTWLAETTPYLLLAAPAGRGKSALLVRWLDSLKARDDLALAFVPVSIRFGTNMERVFYAALAARLAYLHGDDIPASPETSTAVYRGLVSDYLSKPLANGRTLMVVLDGLDEAADWQAGADFMPGELPAGVRVVVSARFLARDADSKPWLGRLNWERNGLASAPSLTPLDKDGVRDVLFKMGCPLDELSRNVDIVSELYRLSAGDPLLVGLYVGDLWAKGDEVTRLKPEDLAGIQPGYKGYFDRWWDDQKKLWGKDKPWLEKHVRAVRSLLAGTLGPLFRDDFQALDPELESDYIADALEVLQRFIFGDNQNQGYTFSHPKLGQYFWEALTLTEQMQVEGRFLTWGEQTLQEFIDGKREPRNKTEIPVYVVRNYSAHLARAEQPIEKWQSLIHHQQWAQAWFTVEGAYGGYLQDVQRVWERYTELDRQTVQSTGKARYLYKQIRCALIEASLHSLADNIPPKLIEALIKNRIWTLPQALISIKQMSRKRQQYDAITEMVPIINDEQFLELIKVIKLVDDEELRTNLLISLIPRLSAKKLENILEIVQTIKDDVYRIRVLNKYIPVCPQDNLKEIISLTLSIKDEYERAGIFSILVHHLPDSMLAEFPTYVYEIKNEVSRAKILCNLTKRKPEFLDNTVATIRLIQRQSEQAIAWGILASHITNASDEALNILAAIPEESEQVYALNRLIVLLPDERLIELWERSCLITDKDERYRVLISLAQYLPKQNLFRVLELINSVDDEYKRSELLSVLSKRFEKEHLRQILDLAKHMKYEWGLARILNNLIDVLSETELENILDIAKTIRDEGARSTILAALAKHLPQNKLSSLLDIAKLAKRKDDYGVVLIALANRLPEYAPVAWEIVSSMENNSIRRIEMLSQLVYHLPEKIYTVLETAQIIKDDDQLIDLYIGLRKYFPEASVDALRIARGIQIDWRRIRILSILSRYIVELADEVLSATHEIKDKKMQVSMLAHIVECLPDNKLEPVLAEARSIESIVDRANVLIGLVKRLPQVANEAIETILKISDETLRVNILVKLVEHLPKKKMEKILEITPKITDDWNRARLLISLIGRIHKKQLPKILIMGRNLDEIWMRANLLAALAIRLPGVVNDVIGFARILVDNGERARVLCQIAQIRPDVCEEALDATMLIQDSSERASLLISLALYCPALTSRKIFKAAETIDDEDERANILENLIMRMPKTELALITEVISGFDEGANYIRTLIALSHRLPNMITDAVNVACKPSEEKARARWLNELVQPIMKRPQVESYSLLTSGISKLAKRTRPNLLSDLTVLMPVIIHLGTPNTPREIYEAVRDVTTWWP